MGYADFLYSITGEFLYMKTIYDAFGLGEGNGDNPAHGIGQVKGHFLHSFTGFLVYLFEHLYDILRFGACDSCHKAFLMCMPVTVGDKSV